MICRKAKTVSLKLLRLEKEEQGDGPDGGWLPSHVEAPTREMKLLGSDTNKHFGALSSQVGRGAPDQVDTDNIDVKPNMMIMINYY